jgi:hypothetical protein
MQKPTTLFPTALCMDDHKNFSLKFGDHFHPIDSKVGQELLKEYVLRLEWDRDRIAGKLQYLQAKLEKKVPVTLQSALDEMEEPAKAL